MPTQLFNGHEFLGSFDDLALEFAKDIDSLQKEKSTAASSSLVETVEKTLASSDQDAVMKLLVESSVALQSAPEKNEKNIVPAYNLLLYLANSTKRPSIYLSKICMQLASSTNPMLTTYNGPGTLLFILSTIYNMVSPDSPDRYHVFMSILSVVKQSSSYESIKPQIENTDSYIKLWKLDPACSRQLYEAIAALASDAGDAPTAYRQHLKCLATYQDNDASSKEAKALGCKVVRSALLEPSQFDFQDLAGQAVVGALGDSKDANESLWVELLDTFVAGKLEEFTEFQADNQEWLRAQKLDEAVLQRKIRLLTLATLGAEAGAGGDARLLKYNDIAEQLEIDESEVEMWVIDVIRAGLVEGKLRQLDKTFLIHRSTFRTFGLREWRDIEDRLTTWRQSLTNVLQVVQSERAKFQNTLLSQQQQQQQQQQQAA